MKIAVKNLRPNPFRHLERYPIDDVKVDALKKSIKETTFWDNVLVRPATNGHDGFELAYGHHRYIALKKLGVDKIDVPCRDLDDTTMAKIMAYENQEEWGTNAKVEMETIRSIVEGFAEGRIELPKVSNREHGSLRYAPSFVGGGKGSSQNRELLYSAESLARFTGKSLSRVEKVLTALAAAEKELINTEDLKDLTTHQAVTVAREVSRIAKETEDQGLAKKIGIRLARGMRTTSGRVVRGPGSNTGDRDITITNARRRANEMVGKRAAKKPKALPPIEKFCEQLADALVEIPSDAMRAKLDAIVENREHLRGQDQRLIVGALRGLIKRAEKYIEKLEG